MNTADFEAYYKNASNAELVAVLENQQDYQPQAIAAVKNELLSRQLSEKEMDGAYDEWHQQHENINQDRTRTLLLKNKIKTKGGNILQKINPFDPMLAEEERIIRGVLIWFSIIFLYSIISRFNELLFYIRYTPYWHESILFLFPYIVLPVSLILFALRKRAGWLGLTFLLGTIVLVLLGSFIMALTYQASVFGPLFNLDIRPAVIDILIPIIIVGVSIYALCKPGVRAVFNISRNAMIITGVLSAIMATMLFIITSYGF